MRTNPAARARLHICAMSAALCLAAGAAAAAPLTIDDAVDLAQRDAPTLAAVAARIDAARQAATSAGELPDPKLRAGVENYPVSGPMRFDPGSEPMSMLRIGVMQDMPNRDKRDARIAVAQARIDRAQAERGVAAALARREAALAWIRRYTVERQLTQVGALVDENRLFEAAVAAQVAGGKGSAADALMPRQEAAMIAERRDELAAQRAIAVAGLRRWIGTAATEPLAGSVPAWPVGVEALQARLHEHPELSAFDAMAGMLDAEMREAQAMKQPDWGVEVAYQKRAPTFGDMVSVMVNIELPLFAERRQDPQIAAKAAERRALDAEREAAQREHRQMLTADLAELQRLQRAVKRYDDELLPLGQQRVELLLAGYRGGRSTLAELIAARRERAELQLKALATEGERDAMAARLHFTYDDSRGVPR